MNERAPLPPTLHAACDSCVLRNAEKSRAGFLHLSPGPVLRSVGFYRLHNCKEVSPTLLGDTSCCMRLPVLKSRETLGNFQGVTPSSPKEASSQEALLQILQASTDFGLRTCREWVPLQGTLALRSLLLC